MRSTVALLILAADDGRVTFRAMPGRQPAVPFVLDTATLADGDARFTNPAHDDPQVIHYVRKGDALAATVSKLTSERRRVAVWPARAAGARADR